MEQESDYLFTGYVHPEPMFTDDDDVPASEFSDVHVRAMKLDGLPLTWGHHQAVSIGEVEETYDTATGAKCITGRIRGDSPLARSVIKRMRNSELNELSLETEHQIEGVKGQYYTEGKTPIRVAVVKKGERKNCFIHPNSVIEVPRRNRPSRPILPKTEKPSKQRAEETSAMADTTTTTPADAAAQAQQPPAQTQNEDTAMDTSAQAPPAETTAAAGQQFEDMLDAETMLTKHPEMTQQQLAGLLASVAKRNAAIQADFEKTRAELDKVKATAENLTKTHEEEILDMAKDYYETMKANGVAVPDGAAEQFAELYKHWGPEERVENGRFLTKTVFAHSASFAEANRRKDEEIDRLKRENLEFARKIDAGDTKFNAFNRMIEGRASSAAASAVPNATGGDGNARPLKRSKPEDDDLFARFLPPLYEDSAATTN